MEKLREIIIRQFHTGQNCAGKISGCCVWEYDQVEHLCPLPMVFLIKRENNILRAETWQDSI